MAIKTEQGTTDDGKHIYTPSEHESLSEHMDMMGDEDFEDLNRAKADGRVRDPDSSEEDSASKGMEEMTMYERAKELNDGTSPVRSSDDDRVQRLNRDPGRSW